MFLELIGFYSGQTIFWVLQKVMIVVKSSSHCEMRNHFYPIIFLEEALSFVWALMKAMNKNLQNLCLNKVRNPPYLLARRLGHKVYTVPSAQFF